VTCTGPTSTGTPSPSSTKRVSNRRSTLVTLDPGRPGEERFHRRAHSRFDTRRPDDDERTGPALELAVEDHEGHAAEVVTVQVREDHRVDRLRVDAEAAHRDQGRRAAVEEELARGDLLPALMISCRS
jgi:hypothetical protein